MFLLENIINWETDKGKCTPQRSNYSKDKKCQFENGECVGTGKNEKYHIIKLTFF